jgi:peptidoglycan hydrolase-like protein with peptidoglycan-binding domain
MSRTSPEHDASWRSTAWLLLLVLPLAACSATWDGLSKDTSALFGSDEEKETDSAEAQTARRAEAPPSVLEVQRLLDEQGYDPGPVDGVFGDRTARAIRSYQTNNGLPVTGRVSAGLLQRLRAPARDAPPDAPTGDL